MCLLIKYLQICCGGDQMLSHWNWGLIYRKKFTAVVGYIDKSFPSHGLLNNNMSGGYWCSQPCLEKLPPWKVVTAETHTWSKCWEHVLVGCSVTHGSSDPSLPRFRKYCGNMVSGDVRARRRGDVCGVLLMGMTWPLHSRPHRSCKLIDTLRLRKTWPVHICHGWDKDL